MDRKNKNKITIGMFLTFVIFLLLVVVSFVGVGFGINTMSHSDVPYIALFGKSMVWVLPSIIVISLVFAVIRKNKLDDKR